MKNPQTPRPIAERTFEFAVRIVKLCFYLDTKRGTVKVLGPQIVRAGTSIGANVEEAQAAQSKTDFISENEHRSQGSPRNTLPTPRAFGRRPSARPTDPGGGRTSAYPGLHHHFLERRS